MEIRDKEIQKGMEELPKIMVKETKITSVSQQGQTGPGTGTSRK